MPGRTGNGLVLFQETLRFPPPVNFSNCAVVSSDA